MHRGSIALAASTLPISSVSQPNDSKISSDYFFCIFIIATNKHGWHASHWKFGLYIKALPTLLNAFTILASGIICCEFFPSMIHSSVVKNFNTPFSGGTAAIGLVASITVLLLKFSLPASVMASSTTAHLYSKHNAALQTVLFLQTYLVTGRIFFFPFYHFFFGCIACAQHYLMTFF